ncbi:TrkH family potassium uptake protein [Aureliella helgolandensis]|uniref:Trk system potassium uptake protein TrkG n=1 Tax=Aureliella helgolandensis TaxID=2527968 RepID=A0A518G0H2_9BACT|nr:TrkH family potassium uptake protein [Aureliella helgolandensis]QDV22066.1 Trk system potassium uptake protein TrkG [Aureliella helgolandensis]
MNFRLLSRMLGVICLLFAVTMLFSLPWAHPVLGWRAQLETRPQAFEWAGFRGLLTSCLVSLVCGCVFTWYGRPAKGQKLFRKEAMATVGLSWMLATLLGALPFVLSGTRHPDGSPISFVDALFESQSGFSTTGATILGELENPVLVPHCILFWRCSTHFLGGLGIVVLLVALLGQGASGKAMMRAEITGPTKDSSYSRMQKTAGVFASIYVLLNLLLAMTYWWLGMSVFDALCHAFSTMATGGFSTYNASLGHFDSPWIDYVTVLFMVLAGSNFGLLLLVSTGRVDRLLKDVEFQVYICIIVVVTAAIVTFGLWSHDFENFFGALRYALFQVVSVLTTTGYGTQDFDRWNNFGRGVLLLIMFVGGCAGSTSGGMKVIRHVMFVKILRHELELTYRPHVVRPLRIGDQIIEDINIRKHILVYVGLVSAIFAFSWLLLITVEPDTQWNAQPQVVGAENQLDHKLLDCASAVIATLHNVGPGLGVVGPTANYAGFSPWSKLWFVFLMMLGRLELFSILVLFIPAFWRKL